MDNQPSSTLVLLIRHGQNTWAGSNRLAGRLPGIFLNKQGKQQAKATGKYLAKQHPVPVIIYSSPLERTMETAQLIARYVSAPVKKCPGVIEADMGKWTGQAIADLTSLPHWMGVQYYPGVTQFPGGESFLAMQTRAVETINGLAAAHPGKTIVVVSHADIIKSVAAFYLGAHLDMFQRLIISPASITTLVFTSTHPMLQCLNQTSHLPPEGKFKSTNKKPVRFYKP